MIKPSEPRWGNPLGRVTIQNVLGTASKNHAGELSREGKAMPKWTRKDNIPESIEDRTRQIDWVDGGKRWKGAVRHDD